MPIFEWFNKQEAGTFAQAIAADLMGRIPVSVEGNVKKVTPERVNNAHEAIVSRARAFASAHKLNWYTKAHLGNTFRWELAEKGYDSEFVDAWTHALLVALSAPRKKDL